jgi:hypothetical protein
MRISSTMTSSFIQVACVTVLLLTSSFSSATAQAPENKQPLSRQIRGRITVEGGAPVPVAEITFDDTTGQKFAVTRSLLDGTFAVQLGDAEWRPHVRTLLEGYRVVSIVAGSNNLLVSPLPIGGSDPPEIAITLAALQPGLKVSGHIFSGLVASGVRVSLTNRWIKIETTARTDGSFEFLQVPKDTYSIDTTDYRPVRTIFVDRDITDLDIRPSWQLKGRVMTLDDAPEPPVTLWFQPVPLSNSPTKAVGPFWPHERFDMYLPPGEYRLQVRDLPAVYKLRSITFGSLDLQRETLKVVGEFHSDEALELTFERLKAQYARISGRVVAPKGSDPYMATLGVSLVSSNGHYSAAVDSDGQFEFPKVIRGEYRIFATPNGPLRTLNVNRKELRNVEIVLPKLRKIRGRIRVEGDYPLPRAWYEAITRGMHPLPGNGVTTQWDGTFVLTIPEGQHAFEVAGYAAPYRIQSIRFGRADLLKDPLIIDRSTGDEILVTYEVTPSSWFRVAGRLIGAERLPAGVNSVNVVLDGEFPIVLKASLDPNGLFEFPKVPTGVYILTTEPAIAGVFGKTIVVSDRDVSGLEFAVPQQRQVVVRVAGDPPPSGYRFFVKQPDGKRYQIITNSAVAVALGRTDVRCVSDVCSPAPLGLLVNEPKVVSGSSKEFTINLAEGDYRIELGFAESYTLQSLEYRAANLLQDSLHLQGVGPHEIVATFGSSRR